MLRRTKLLQCTIDDVNFRGIVDLQALAGLPLPRRKTMASSKKPPVGGAKSTVAAISTPVPPAPAKAAAPIQPVMMPAETGTPKVKAAASAPVIAKSPAPPASEYKPVAAAAPHAPQPGVMLPVSVLKPVTALQENVRANTEKALTAFRGQYAEVKTIAETATTRLEDSMKAAQEGSRALGFKMFEIAKAQTHAHLDHAKTLAAAKTLPELLSAQQSFFVSQIERAQSGGKDVASLAAQVAHDVTAPLRASMDLLVRR
jgi:hypothetical protein